MTNWKPHTSKLLSVETLRGIQADLYLNNAHVVHIAAGGFSIAHTEVERQRPQELIECELHKQLDRCTSPPRDLGVYIVENSYDDEDFEPGCGGRYMFMWAKLEESLANG